jgi:hypothetical protein
MAGAANLLCSPVRFPFMPAEETDRPAQLGMEVGISPTRGQVVARFIICSSGSDQEAAWCQKKFVVYRSALVCLYELAITQAVGLNRCWQAGTTLRGDSLHGLIRAGRFAFFQLIHDQPSE